MVFPSFLLSVSSWKVVDIGYSCEASFHRLLFFMLSGTNAASLQFFGFANSISLSSRADGVIPITYVWRSARVESLEKAMMSVLPATAFTAVTSVEKTGPRITVAPFAIASMAASFAPSPVDAVSRGSSISRSSALSQAAIWAALSMDSPIWRSLPLSGSSKPTTILSVCCDCCCVGDGCGFKV